MSGLIDQFKVDFDLWEWRLRFIENQTDESIEDIKTAIRGAWDDKVLRQLWMDFVEEQADESRALRKIAADSLKRIKEKA